MSTLPRTDNSQYANTLLISTERDCHVANTLCPPRVLSGDEIMAVDHQRFARGFSPLKSRVAK
jgi:hypothetical protein